MQLDISTCVVIAILLCVIVCGFIWFYKLPKNAKIAEVKEWLKWAVVEAEKFLGGGTGQLKLRYVYDLAIEKFPWLVNICTFEMFSSWVDEALEWMKDQIEKNARIENFIKLVQV